MNRRELLKIGAVVAAIPMMPTMASEPTRSARKWIKYYNIGTDDLHYRNMSEAASDRIVKRTGNTRYPMVVEDFLTISRLNEKFKTKIRECAERYGAREWHLDVGPRETALA